MQVIHVKLHRIQQDASNVCFPALSATAMLYACMSVVNASLKSIDNPFVRPSEMMFGPTKGGKFINVITRVISANRKAEFCE